MYIEAKPDGINGPARIGRVTFSQSGKSIYYQGRRFASFKGGFKANYFDCESGDEYWISGCKRNGGDRLYAGTIYIDEDAREEYWAVIRRAPERRTQAAIRCSGKYGGRGPN